MNNKLVKKFHEGHFFDPKPLFEHLTHFAVIGMFMVASTKHENDNASLVLLVISLILFFMNIVRGTILYIVWSAEKKWNVLFIGLGTVLYWMSVFLIGSMLLSIK
jgi:hypothetical protein